MPDVIAQQKKTTIDDYCSLQRDNSEIELRVDILGNFQTATSTVRWNGARREDLLDSFTLPLGQAKDLIDVVMYLDTVITDTNTDPLDNYTGMRVQLKGGPKTFDRTLSAIVAAGETEDYKIKITFYEKV